MTDDAPLYLFDVNIAALAPDPVEPPPALNLALDMVDVGLADGLNMQDFFGGAPPNNFG